MEICKYLSQEGVCYVKKDFNLAKHLEIDVPILQGVHLALRESTNLVTVMDTVEETRVVLLLSADYRPSFGVFHMHPCFFGIGIVSSLLPFGILE
ncbi:uncharacterized protein DS421_5g150300 [Arachis hypogaea]|nr:uncharacterized protein DS421_5g150300 [Arachis hypogaea]